MNVNASVDKIGLNEKKNVPILIILFGEWRSWLAILEDSRFCVDESAQPH